MNVITPSLDFLTHKGKLAEIAVYAKAANQMDLYNQAKEAHDNLVRQYNAQLPQTSSRKKGWTPFRGEDEAVFSAPLECFEDDSINQILYEHAKTLSQFELSKKLSEAVDSFNRSSRHF